MAVGLVFRGGYHPRKTSCERTFKTYPSTYFPGGYLGRGVNREGFNFKLAMVKKCST